MTKEDAEHKSHDRRLEQILNDAAATIANSCDIGVVLHSADAEVGRLLKAHLARRCNRSRATAYPTLGVDKDDSASGGSF